MRGNRDPVHSLALEPGDLQIFRGRHSLHRVTRVEGDTPRYIAIFSYARQPNMVGKPQRMRTLYGKVLPIHFEAEKRIGRGDVLED